MSNRSIAIVGSGISGLSAAWHLSENNKIFLFEKGDRLGGHTHTHIFNTEDDQFSVDSGFIVFNKVRVVCMNLKFAFDPEREKNVTKNHG